MNRGERVPRVNPERSKTMLRIGGRALSVAGGVAGFAAINYLFYGQAGFEHAAQVLSLAHSLGEKLSISSIQTIEIFMPGVFGLLAGTVPGGMLHSAGN